MTKYHGASIFIPIAMCDLDSPVGSPSLNGSSLLSLGICRTSPQWNCLQIKNSSLVSKNVLDNFCQIGTNEISTFRGCLQLTAFPFRSQDCEEILPGCNFHPSGSFYRALHLSEFCSVLFSATCRCWLVIARKLKTICLADWGVELDSALIADTNRRTPAGVDDDCY